MPSSRFCGSVQQLYEFKLLTMIYLQMTVIKNNDINPAVISPAFLGLIGGDGDGMGKPGNLEAGFVKAYVGKVVENVD